MPGADCWTVRRLGWPSKNANTPGTGGVRSGKASHPDLGLSEVSDLRRRKMACLVQPGQRIAVGVGNGPELDAEFASGAFGGGAGQRVMYSMLSRVKHGPRLLPNETRLPVQAKQQPTRATDSGVNRPPGVATVASVADQLGVAACAAAAGGGT